MSGPDDIVREALASLLEDHPRAMVTDPGAVRSLLEAKLGPSHRVDPALLDALVLATHTPVLRNLADDARPDTTEAQLENALRKLGVGGSIAAVAATRWAEALLPGDRRGAFTTAPPVTRTAAPTDQPRPAAAAPPPPPPPLPPDPRPARPRPAWLEAPTLPHEILEPRGFASDTGDAPAHEPAHEPAALLGASRDADGPARPERRRWPRAAKTLAGVLALLAVVLGAVAFVGWTRDPSKSRASSAESEVAQLSNNLATAKQATVDANAATAAAKATIAERDAQLAAAKDQIAKMATVNRSQLNNARFPDSFTMSGKVAAGSCSLTGEACNVTAVVRNIKLACATKPCDCTTGSCTVTSELWRTAAPVTFDVATNLFSAKGLLDGDVFRCAGVAQPTTFDFRFRVSKVNFDEGVWKVSGLDAELAEASSAVAECLAGNRTYALTGPVA